LLLLLRLVQYEYASLKVIYNVLQDNSYLEYLTSSLSLSPIWINYFDDITLHFTSYQILHYT